ncbi:MAG TPA: ATP-binding protein [Candidatus Eisenbacteria bacterium]|nr:ATP-binding protein [Candidatus Eisenbacteria bacterium]
MRIPSTLRTSLFFLILVTLLPAMGLLFYQAHEQKRLAAAETQKSALRLARELAIGQERLIDLAQQLLVAVAQLPQVYKQDAEACGPLFSTLLAQYPLYLNIGLLRTDGTLIASAIPPPESGVPVSMKDLPFFRQVLQQRDFVIGDFQRDPITGTPTIQFGFPVMDKEWKIRSVVFIELDLGWVNKVIRSSKVSPGTDVTILDKYGTVLTRYPHPDFWSGRHMPENSLVSAVLSRQSGTVETGGLDGVTRLYAFTPLTGAAKHSMYLTAGVSKRAAFEPVEAVFRRSLLGLALAGFLSLAAAWIGTEWFVVRRVRRLVGATKRLARGEPVRLEGLMRQGDEFGVLARAFGEMTEALKKREAELLEAGRAAAEARSNERFQALVVHANTAIISIDAQSRITLWNPAAERLFGYSAAEALGRDVAPLIIPEEYRQSHYEGMKRFLATGQGPLLDQSIQITAQRADESVFPVELSLFQSEAGPEPRFTAIIRDITERKRKDEALRRAHEELEQRVQERTASLARSLDEQRRASDALARSNRELEQFAYVASHDLQEPLRKIITFSDRLKSRAPNGFGGKDLDYFQRMQNAGLRMKNLIEDLLNFSRVTSVSTPVEKVELSDIVKEVLKDLELRVIQTEAKIRVEELPAVRANAVQMRQLFQNLIGNSLKFARPGVPPDIRVRSRELGNRYWEITVADNGIGFEEKYLDRIFKPFQRLHGQDEYEGTGIGLAICQKIVQRYGGEIGATSRPGEGATFIFTLPSSAV